MTPEQDRLTAALADRYEILRELGAGGMATVYLARDLKLQRQVALKVLRPELAQSLGPERFLREIEIAAQLHHPHILALHDSGEAEGFLYYVMPYVEGESLRDRIAREGELPVADTVRILREMVDALALAHSQNVVHRDIKPDNVMLSGRHALVMDFGIAKAVSEATGGGMVTTVGMALGTPAYMAPEQAAADPGVDHRADIYAIGATAYEMLTGRPPFQGRTQQEVLAAHISKTPEPVDQVRSAVPPTLAELVMRCLAKKPADRWQSAEAMLPVLEGLGTSSGGMTPTRGLPATRRKLPRWLLPVAAVVVIVAVLGVTRFNKVGASGTLIGEQALAADDLILVGEFTNETADSTLGATITDAVRVELQQSDVVRVLSQSGMWEGYRRMDRDPTVVQPDSVTRELAQREGAKAYVSGTIQRLGTGYQLTARILAAVGGAELRSVRVTAAGDGELIAAVQELGQELRSGIGESLRSVRASQRLAAVTTASLPALRLYVAGSRESARGRLQRGRELLLEATRIDTAFAAAWRSLSITNANMGEYTESRRALARAFEFQDRLSEASRASLAPPYYEDRGELLLAENAHRQLVESSEGSSAKVNFTEFLLKQRRFAEAESLAILTRDASPKSLAAHWNAIEVQVAQRKFAAADSSVTVAQTGLGGPDNNRGSFFRALVWMAQWQLDSAVAAVESREGQGPWWLRCADPLYRGQLGAAGRCSPAPDEGLARLMALLRLRAIGDQGGVDEWPPLVEQVGQLRPEERAERIAAYAEAGRVAEAKAAVAAWLRAAGADDRVYLNNAGLVAGAIAMAEGRPDSAARAYLAYNRAGFLTAEHHFGRGLPEAANAFDRAGEPDSAIAYYEAALTTPSFSPGWVVSAALWYPIALRRLGELYEAKGDRAKALDYYQRFTELWQDADPELQPQVADVRARIAALVGEPGG